MERVRSPNYPSVSLPKAIELVGRIHAHNRTNSIDREAAVKDMGYTSLSGRSAKLLATLAQFDLVERAGKGGVRVSRRAVDILHPVDDVSRKAALAEAGLAPSLFQQLAARFPDGVPSENSIRSYLTRENFADAALGPAITSFLETYSYLRQEGAYDSHGTPANPAAESVEGEGNAGVSGSGVNALVPYTPPTEPAPRNEGVRIMENERVVFSEETSGTQYLKLVASGDLDENLLEALQDYIKRQKKRLGVA